MMMNMMVRMTSLLAAADEVTGNGAALISFYGRGFPDRSGKDRRTERRIRRRERDLRV